MSCPPPAGKRPAALSVYLWLSTVPLIWGTHFVLLKIIFQEYSIWGTLSIRYLLISATLLLVLWRTERNLCFERRDVPYLAGFALVMVVVYQLLFNYAAKLASAAESALLISTAPIFAALLAAALGWERLTRRLAAGVILAFLGIVAVIFGGEEVAAAPATHALGSTVMLISAVMWGSYAVLAKPLLAKYSPLKVTAYCHSAGALVLVPLGLPNALAVTPGVVAQLGDPARLHHAFWVLFGLLFYGLLSGAFALVMWYRGVEYVGSARTMLFQFCVPVVGLVAAIIFRREYPSLLQWVGVALTLAGVVVAVSRHVGAASPAAEGPGP